MGKLANNLQSFTPYHPGELVKDELEYRAIKQKDFAEKFNISYSVLNEVLNGKRNITSEFALVLEALWASRQMFWLEFKQITIWIWLEIAIS